MKKIALVSCYAWQIYNYRMGVVRALHEQGYEIMAVSLHDDYAARLEETGYIRHYPLRYLAPQGQNPFKDFLLLFELYRLYRRLQPDGVLHYTIKPNIYGSIAARLTDIPCINTVTGLGYTFIQKKKTNRLVRCLYRFAFRKVYRIVFHNQDDYRLFTRLGLAESAQCTVSKGSGVNTAHFRPAARVSPNPVFVFLFVGRIIYDKGIGELVGAIRKLREEGWELECQVLGDSEAGNPTAVPQSVFREWIDEGFIRYLGETDDIRPFFQEADAVVLPSYREGLSKVLLEGLAMGKPLIATNVPGCRETIEEGANGFLVPLRNAGALADAMRRMMELSPEAIAAMGQRSREKALREFDDQLVIQQYLALVAGLPERNK